MISMISYRRDHSPAYGLVTPFLGELQEDVFNGAVIVSRPLSEIRHLEDGHACQ